MSSQGGAAGPGLMDRARLGLGIAGVVLLVLFFLQNLQDVELNLLWFTWNTSMVWALLLAAVLGALAMFFFTTIRGRRRADRA